MLEGCTELTDDALLPLSNSASLTALRLKNCIKVPFLSHLGPYYSYIYHISFHFKTYSVEIVRSATKGCSSSAASPPSPSSTSPAAIPSLPSVPFPIRFYLIIVFPFYAYIIGISHLKRHPHLRTLRLANAASIRNNAMPHVANLSELRHLDLNGNFNLLFFIIIYFKFFQIGCIRFADQRPLPRQTLLVEVPQVPVALLESARLRCRSRRLKW